MAALMPFSQALRAGSSLSSSLRSRRHLRRHGRVNATVAADTDLPLSRTVPPTEADFIIVGSGIGGLSAAALLSAYGHSVVVLESHALPGGCAHSFSRDGYTFDSGPSFFSGLSGADESPGKIANNPLANVLKAVGESIEVTTYKAWDFYLPEGVFRCETNGERYASEVRKVGGEQAYRQWVALTEFMEPMVKAASALPPAALRFDLGAALTTSRYLPKLIESAGPSTALLQQPFAAVLDKAGVTDPWLRNMMDLECFLLSGQKASGTIAAEMAFIFSERNLPTSTVDYPKGGAGAIVDALIRAIEKRGGVVATAAHVDSFVVENGTCCGVRMSESGRFKGQQFRAKEAVISNASCWETAKLIPDGVAKKTISEKSSVPPCESFMHLHLGIDATGLPDDLDIHHVVVDSWDRPGGAAAEQNAHAISIPTVIDPSLAPEGKHIIHAYTAGNEPWELWSGLERNSQEYKDLKEERTQSLWRALERVIPDVRERTEVKLIGSPLTHSRYLRRSFGSYGPAIDASEAQFPGPGTDLPGLYCCGESTLPGIGVPAVAGSGMIAANTLSSVWKHIDMLDFLEGKRATF